MRSSVKTTEKVNLHHAAMNSTQLSSRNTTTALRGIRAQLETEWNRLCRRSDLQDVASRWDLDLPSGLTLRDVLHATGFERTEHAGSEALLRQLVLHAAHDAVAARVVLQRILPGLVASIRHRDRSSTIDDAFTELVSAAWMTIRTYDERRRPACLAAALIDGAVYRAFKVERRRQLNFALEEHEYQLAHAEGERVTTMNELRQVLAEAHRKGVSAEDLVLIHRLATGTSTEDIARECGVTARAIRYRSARIAAALASLVTTD